MGRSPVSRTPAGIKSNSCAHPELIERECRGECGLIKSAVTGKQVRGRVHHHLVCTACGADRLMFTVLGSFDYVIPE